MSISGKSKGRRKFRDDDYIKKYNQLYHLNKTAKLRKIKEGTNIINPLTGKRKYLKLKVNEEVIKALEAQKVETFITNKPIIVKF